MRRRKPALGSHGIDAEVLEAALIGLEHRRSEIDEKMAELRRKLGSRAARGTRMDARAGSAAAPVRKKRTLSAGAGRRIAAAQRKRWAALKKGQAAKQAPVKKRTLSAAARKRIAEATTKRWAEFRAKKAAAVKKATGKSAAKAAGRRGAA
jgi:hypothetical protein